MAAQASSGGGTKRADEGEMLMVDIPSVGRDRDHVTYTIQVEKGDIVWSVTRRYRDFQLLNKRLAQTFDKDRLPKLPPKRIRLGKAKYDEDFVEERRGLLLMYLIRVVHMADVERVETLDDFLEFSENYIFGSLRALEHIPEVQGALATLRRASAGTGSLTVSAARSRPSFDDDGSSVRSGTSRSVPPSENSSVTSDGDSRGDRSSIGGGISGAGAGAGAGAGGDGNTTTSVASPVDLQAALKFMVKTLKGLLDTLQSEADDIAAEYTTQRGVVRFLTTRYATRQDELREAARLWEEDQEQQRRDCEEATREKGVVQSQLQLLDRELQSMHQRVEALEQQTNVHNGRYKALYQKLLTRLNGQHPGPQPASPVPSEASLRGRPAIRFMPGGAQPPTPPRPQQQLQGVPASPARSAATDRASDDGSTEPSSSVGAGAGVVPGAAASIAALVGSAPLTTGAGTGAGTSADAGAGTSTDAGAGAGEGTGTSTGAGAGEDAAAAPAAAESAASTSGDDGSGSTGAEPGEDVSQEDLAGKVALVEEAHRMFEEILVAQESAAGAALDAPSARNAHRVLADVAAVTSKVHRPGAAGSRAQLLKLLHRVMQENIVLTQRVLEASSAGRADGSGGGRQQVSRRLDLNGHTPSRPAATTDDDATMARRRLSHPVNAIGPGNAAGDARDTTPRRHSVQVPGRAREDAATLRY